MTEFIQPGMYVSFDTETSGLHWDPPDEARVAVVSYAWRNTSGKLLSKAHPTEGIGKSGWDRLIAGLSRCNLITHNGKFDCHMVEAGTTQGWPGIDLSEPVIWDTQVAEMVLEPLASVTRLGAQTPLALKTISEKWGLLGGGEADLQQMIKDWHKKNKIKVSQGWSVRNMPWALIGPYAARDAELTYLLWELQTKRIENGEEWAGPIIEREMLLWQVLYNMERRGIGFNKEACNAAASDLKRELGRVGKSLPFLPTLPKAKAYFFGNGAGALNLVPYKTTEKRGDPQLDEEVVGRLAAAKVPGGKEYQRYRQFESALTKWYANWPELAGRDDRLRTVHSQTNVRSGRLSVSRVQLQAIPHDSQLPTSVPTIRSFFRPRTGSKLFELDLKNAEVRVAAAITNCVNMKEIILAGKDVHDETCKRIFDKHPEDPEWKRYRDIAKRLTFGTIYGGGARALREAVALYTGVDLGPGEAESLIADYRDLYPEFYRTARRAEALAASRGFVRLVSGRQRWFAPDEGYHKAFNAIIQGGVAEVMKDWMIAIERRVPTVLLLQIHDSLVIEVPDNKESLAFIPNWIKETGCQLFEDAFHFPFAADLKEWGPK